MSQAGATGIVPIRAQSDDAGSARVVGILAGGGSIPREIAESVVARGGQVHIVAIAGEADEAWLSRFPSTRVGWGQIGAMVQALKDARCDVLVIVGSVNRPDLSKLRPDLGFFLSLPAIVRIITAGGDDGVLTRVVRFFENKGLRVVGPGAVAPELLVGQGPVGRVGAEPAIASDVALGFELVRALGPYDVGQGVIVTQGRVEAIEGAEGTDGMLERVGRARADDSAAQATGVLVKRPKPGQELRIDLPAIGPGTVERSHAAGLAGVAVQAGCALVAERAELVQVADADGLFVQGFEDTAEPAFPGTPQMWHVQHLGKRAPTSQAGADAAKGVALLGDIHAIAPSRGTVVNRGHVLAVESGEGVAELIRRAAGLRQWGRWHRVRAAGTLVLSDPEALIEAVKDVAAAGLAGVALVGHPPAGVLGAVAEADRLGLFVATVSPSGGKR